jgi:hypothetical protein
MGSVARHRFMALDADAYGVTLEQRLSFRPVILVTGQTALVRGVPVSLGPVLLQLVTPVAQVLINAFFSSVDPAVTQRTLCILRMRIGSALNGFARESVQRIALGKEKAP